MSIPRGAPRTPCDAEAGKIDTKASEQTTSPPRRAAEPNAARTPAELTARLTSASYSLASIPRGAQMALRADRLTLLRG